MTPRSRDLRTDALTRLLAAQGGTAHSSIVRAQGFTRHDVLRALDAGALERIRRSWLVVPNADLARRAAARVSGRVTCVTQAQRLGLWVPPSRATDAGDPGAHDPHDLHIAVPHSASRLDATGVQLHWAQGPVPVAHAAAEDPLLNVLFHVARCLPRVDALAVWESALRQNAVAGEVLARVKWRSPRAAELAGAASTLSDSGIETAFVAGMSALGVEVVQQVWIDGHPVDGLIGKRLVVQSDGFAHHQARDRRRDLRADARLVLLGYTVLRFDYEQILFDWAHVAQTVLTALAQGLHLAR